MDTTTIVKLGLSEISARLPEILYLHTGIDRTRPVWFHAVINQKCNYKCKQCECWRLKEYVEISIEQWKSALSSIRDFVGRYTIQFCGGEPFIKKGFLELLEHCRSNDIDFGVITNGSAFSNLKVVDRLAASRPLNVDISVDGATPEIHDTLRGVDGSLRVIEEGIRSLRAAQEAIGVRFPIRLKPTINAHNFRSIPGLVRWATEVGASTIDFQPIREWSEESRGELWLKGEDIGEFRSIVEDLIVLKKQGAPVETSDHLLREMVPHFLREPVAPELDTCLVGIRSFTIDPRGVVTTCGDFGPIGDLTRQTAREIWEGPAARENRRLTTACTKGCAFGCMPKPLSEKLRRCLLMLKTQ
jgi:MoaA/NifB/PqqE/SkfB family radical SAM enzyme